MKQKLSLTWVLLWLLTTGMAGVVSAQTQTNLAVRTTRVVASVNNDSHPVTMINDNRTTQTNYWSSYSSDERLGQWEYVELQWNRHNQYNDVRAYWAEDGTNIVVPTEAYISYWDGKTWQRAATLSAPDDKNLSRTEVDITSNRLRIYVRSDQACGIRELRIFGYLGEECAAATLSDDHTTVAWEEGKTITLAPTLTLPEGDEETGLWFWTLPDGSMASTPTVTSTMPGSYTASYQRPCGYVAELQYNVFDPSVSYTWPKYEPTLNYDFRWEYPQLPAPTKGMLPENVGMVGHMEGEWWACGWGNQRTKNKYITDTAIRGLLTKMDEDFAYFRNEFGWPPDKRARNGYFSTVYIYGSGIEGNSDYTALGGW